MNIFLRELRANFKSLLIWVVVVALFVVVGFSKFAAYQGNPDLLAILDSMPPTMLAAFNLNAFNLTTITGFFGVMFTYFALLLSVAAAMWGADIITKEQRERTVEFALTLPVTRSQVVTQKALAAVVNCLALLLATWAACLLSATFYKTDAQFFQFVALCMLALFIMQLVFLAIGLFLGCALTRYKQAGSLALGILLATYFISIISNLSSNLDFLKYLSPFRYFNPVTLLHDSRLDLPYVALSVVIIAVSLAGAYYTYARRDLYI